MPSRDTPDAIALLKEDRVLRRQGHGAVGADQASRQDEEKRSEGLFAQAREAGLDIEALGERIMARKEELKQQFAGGNLPPPHTRSFSGHKLVQDNPVAATGDD